MLFHKIFHKKQSFFSSNLDSYIEDLYSGDLRALPKIFCIFAENTPIQKLKASQVLNESLILFSFDDICKIDIQMRQTTSIEWNIDWQTLKVGNFITKEMSPEEYRESIQKKGCPKNAFIGLCETGKIKGIEKIKLEPKTKNGKYAIEALKFINKDISIKELWKKVLIETRENLNKSHNNQMNVVKVLFENNEINY